MSKNTDKNSFLDEFDKQSAKMEGISLSSPAPKFWLHTGSFVLNKIISGSYMKGWAQGRLGMVAGPPGSGKSFLLGNAIREALNNDIGVLIIDSENAIDDDFLTGLGADVIDNPSYKYRGVVTISQSTNLVSKFTKIYRELGEGKPYLVIIDSLDMLQTDSENEQYVAGEIRGDQGQHSKQIKAMLKRFVNDIKELNTLMLCAKQVYKEQDATMARQSPWVITESTKFAFSQILLVSKLMLKDDKTKLFEGFTLKARGEKTRFAKPFQQCKIEVPYDTGMDPYTGILDVAVAEGVVIRNGAWYTFNGNKFQSSTFSNYQEEILAELVRREELDPKKALNVEIEEEEDTSQFVTAKDIEHIRKTRGKKKTEEAEAEA